MAKASALKPLACPPFNSPDPHLSKTENNRRYKETLDWRDVPAITLWRMRNMKGAVKMMKRQFDKPDADSLTDEQVALYTIERLKVRIAQGKAERRETYDKQVLRITTIESRMKRYRTQYIVETANDEASLRQLCVLEMNMERLERIQDGLMESLEKNEEVSEARINSIVSALQKISLEYRQYQNLMGIDKATREKREAERGGVEYLKNLMRQSRDLLEEHAIKISCAPCAEKGTILQMGFILCHFGGWVWQGYCPKGGEGLKLEDTGKRKLKVEGEKG